MESDDIILHENQSVCITQSTGEPPSQEIKVAIVKLDGEKTKTIEFC